MKIIQKLLDANVNVNEINASGESPLHIAVRHNHPEVVQALLKAEAYPSVTNSIGQTPLDMALDIAKKQGSESYKSNNLLIQKSLSEATLKAKATTIGEKLNKPSQNTTLLDQHRIVTICPHKKLARGFN